MQYELNTQEKPDLKINLDEVSFVRINKGKAEFEIHDVAHPKCTKYQPTGTEFACGNGITEAFHEHKDFILFNSSAPATGFGATSINAINVNQVTEIEANPFKTDSRIVTGAQEVQISFKSGEKLKVNVSNQNYARLQDEIEDHNKNSGGKIALKGESNAKGARSYLE